MKHTRYRIPLLALLLALVVTSCRDKTVQIYTANVPVMQSWEDFRNTTFSLQDARSLEHPGKIYIYQDLLLVNELYQGLHIFNNANPSSPTAVGFLPIHFNTDMGIRNNVLYVDSYTDLLSFDISDPLNPQFLNRTNDVFLPSDYFMAAGYDDAYPMSPNGFGEGVVVGWERAEVTVDVSQQYYWYNRDEVFATLDFANAGGSGSSFIGGVGKAGSTARFAIVEDHLYTVEPNTIDAFDINSTPSLTSTVTLTRNAETLFPFEDKLFVGTTTGMLIYSISSPGNPQYLSEYNHVTACDPVVVEGDKAYVTLRTGNNCFGVFNLLEVIDLSDIMNPVAIASFTMENPRGLGIDGNLLFLCDGPAGLKVFDKTDPNAIPTNWIKTFGDITANDVIPYNDVLIMTSQQGIYQYSYSDPANVQFLSLIPVQN